MQIDARPRQLAREIALLLKSLTLTGHEIQSAVEEVHKRQVLLQRGKAGDECVVESLLRCVLTNHLQAQYRILRSDIPRCMNSSHVSARGVCISSSSHDHIIDDETWAQTWEDFQRDHREANVFVRGKKNPKRADLYLAASGGLVSIEFKYVKPGACDDLNACIAQMKRYSRVHAATVFVGYTAMPVASAKSAQWFRTLRAKLPRTEVVAVCGPELPVFRQALKSA
jgi:hypothetical protein